MALCADVPLRTYTLTHFLIVRYTVCQKTVQNCFCQNFDKFPPIFDNLWQKDGKEAEIMWDALIFHLT